MISLKLGKLGKLGPTRLVTLALAGIVGCTAPQPPGSQERDPSLVVAATHLAINNNRDDTYSVHIQHLGSDGAVVEQATSAPPPTCEAVWAYAARGSRLYTVIARSDGGHGGYHPQVCDLDNGAVHAFEALVVHDSHAGLSPDNAFITATRGADGRIGLLLVDVEAELATQLERPGRLNSDPDWSPDGTSWVYRSDRDGHINLWIETIATGEAFRLTNNPNLLGSRGYGGIGPGRFSPDGQAIAYSCVDAEGRSQLCLVNIDGSQARQLTHGQLEINAMYPSWHPSGDRLLFGATDPDRTEGQFALFEISVGDRGITRLNNQPDGNNLGAVWASGPLGRHGDSAAAGDLP